MSEQNQQQVGPGTTPPDKKRDPLGSIEALMGMLFGAKTAVEALAEDKCQTVEQKREGDRHGYNSASRNFLGLSLMRVAELEDENMELRDRLNRVELRLENEVKEVQEIKRELHKRFDDNRHLMTNNVELRAKIDTLNASDSKQLLEANNALLLENDHLKRSNAGYKARYGTKKSRRRGSKK